LDGIDSGSFLRSDTSDNVTSGTITFDSGTNLTLAAGSTLDINSTNVSIADTNIALDGASTTLTATGALTLTPGGALTLGATGQDATLQGAITTISSNGVGNDITLNAADAVDVNATGAITLDGSSFSIDSTG